MRAQNSDSKQWMTFDFLAMKTTSTSERRAEKDKQKEEARAMAGAIEKPGLHKLELNPYWKDGGTGLPPEETASTVGQKAVASVANDGGLSWLRTDYQSMKGQAERERRSLDDAEKAVYGERRGGESSRRGGWRRDEEDKRSGSDREHRDGGRERDGNGNRNGDRAKVIKRYQSAAGKYWSARLPFKPLSLESLKGRFLKPSDDGSEVEGKKEEGPLLYEEEINKLGAKLVKAELMGNTVMIEEFKSQLASARKAKESHAARKKLDRSGNMGLRGVVRREKRRTARDQKALYSRIAAKLMGKTLDDRFVSSAAQREGGGTEEEAKTRTRAMGETRQPAAFVEKCRHCFNGPELPKHLIVAVGSKAYLSLPAGVSMADGHCLICPLRHHCCATEIDEDVWAEMQLFRRALVRMFESQDLVCVFMETHMSPRKSHHMVLECIPLPKKLGDMAPMFFKKAIMECDEEWAMNKKVVDISSKDIRQSVPRGLPYFAVDFGMQGGFAHVIETEQKFSCYFGKEVVGGMMDLEPRRWRKSMKEHFDDQRKKVLRFARRWKPYDCTKADGRGSIGAAPTLHLTSDRTAAGTCYKSDLWRGLSLG